MNSWCVHCDIGTNCRKRPVPFRSAPTMPSTMDELDSMTRQLIVSELRKTTTNNGVTGKDNISRP